MPYQLSEEIQQVIDERISAGEFRNADEVIQAAFDALQQSDENVAKIQEAIDDWKAGDEGLPLDEAFNLIREGRDD